MQAAVISLREKMGGLSESEQAAAASAIFGKNSMAGWLSIINASDEDFNKLTGAIDDGYCRSRVLRQTAQTQIEAVTVLKSILIIRIIELSIYITVK